MIHSRHQNRKTKTIAEVLAMTMIAAAHPDLARHHPLPVRKTDEWESATEFCAALDRYTGRTMQVEPIWNGN